MKFLPLPDIDRLRQILSYCPETGLFKWNATLSNRAKAGDVAGSPNTKGYISIKVEGKQYKAHRLAWYFVYGKDPGTNEIDHHDLDKGNNRIGNLRLATRKQNNENIPKPKNNTSGFRGVSFQKGDGAWTAYIYHNKKRIHLGRFGDVEHAAMARKKAEAEFFTHHGITEKGQK